MVRKRLLTSESVAQGHPDKVADQISDAVLDSILEKDPYGRVACETLVTTGLAFVAGEFRTDCYVEIPDIVRKTIEAIGYTDAAYGFDCETCAVVTSIDEQSSDISMGVDREGAGDQGLMFGYATRETEECMPLAIVLAHKLVKRLDEVRKTGILPYLRPDGKSQVTVEYEDGKPVRVDTVVLSTQHHPDVSQETIRQDVERCARGESMVRDIQIMTADGSLMWIEYSMHPLLDEEGRVEPDPRGPGPDGPKEAGGGAGP